MTQPKFGGLRVFQTTTTPAPELSEYQKQRRQRILEKSFKDFPITPNPSDKRFFYLLREYPDIFLFKMEDWFQIPCTKTLNKMSEEEKQTLMGKMLQKIEEIGTEKERFLESLLEEIPHYHTTEERFWGDSWDGFTKEMFSGVHSKSTCKPI